MAFNPKVSIVIPVYNGSNYLREAIDSALAQTYKNVEVIVVNDGSDDGGKTEAIAKSYGYKIRYFYKENGGVSTALNLGIQKMTGEYFSWLSHDDMFSKNRIEEDIRVLISNKDAKITFCKIAKIDKYGKIIKESEHPPNIQKFYKVYNTLKKVTNPREALKIGGVDFCSMTTHRICFNEVGYFNDANRTMQDVEMSLLLSRKYTYFHNENAYVYKREHENMGTITLKEQHKKDQQVLMKYLHNNFSIKDFFPGIEHESKEQLIEAWTWMGNLYGGFGANQYADECYKKAFSLFSLERKIRKILSQLIGILFNNKFTKLVKNISKKIIVNLNR